MFWELSHLGYFKQKRVSVTLQNISDQGRYAPILRERDCRSDWVSDWKTVTEKESDQQTETVQPKKKKRYFLLEKSTPILGIELMSHQIRHKSWIKAYLWVHDVGEAGLCAVRPGEPPPLYLSVSDVMRQVFSLMALTDHVCISGFSVCCKLFSIISWTGTRQKESRNFAFEFLYNL